jgi:hypothetical protein
LYGEYSLCRFGRVLAYPAYALYSLLPFGTEASAINTFIFALCYIVYAAANFGVMYLLCRISKLKIFKAYKEKLEKL